VRILYLTCIPSPYKVEFLNELSKYCDLTAIFERKAASDRSKQWKCCDTIKFRQIYLNGVNYSNDSTFSIGAVNHLKKNSYDVIVFGVYHTMTAMITMQYLINSKKNYILSSDGGFKKNDTPIMRIIKRHFIRNASWYLSPGGKTDEYLAYYGASLNDIYRYPFTSLKAEEICQFDYSFDRIKEYRNDLGYNEKKIIVSVGQIIYRKGYDILIEAANKIPREIGIYIAGGSPTPELEQKIKLYDLKNIHFVGFKTKAELKKLYCAADAFVLPTREDIWGLVVIEALSNGLPVITTTKCNSGLELVTDGDNGFLVPVENADLLANRILKILEMDRQTLYYNSIESVKNYHYAEMAYAHEELFKKICEEKQCK
jgi:glycosyltransferase involved in cell wall biosynthesis